MFDHVIETLTNLPGNATLDLGLQDWNEPAENIPMGLQRLQRLQKLFYPAAAPGDDLSSKSPRRRNFLHTYNDDMYWETYMCIQENSGIPF